MSSIYTRRYHPTSNVERFTLHVNEQVTQSLYLSNPDQLQLTHVQYILPSHPPAVLNIKMSTLRCSPSVLFIFKQLVSSHRRHFICLPKSSGYFKSLSANAPVELPSYRYEKEGRVIERRSIAQALLYFLLLHCLPAGALSIYSYTTSSIAIAV